MAKKDDEKPDDEKEKPWSPDQPIPDEEGEAEAQRRHMMNRRLQFLNDEADKGSKKKPAKAGKSLWGS